MSAPFVNRHIGPDDAQVETMLDRLKEEARHRTLIDAIVTSMRTTGAAILFTATTIFAGIIFWIPISTLRFNGEMSLLLCLLNLDLAARA